MKRPLIFDASLQISPFGLEFSYSDLLMNSPIYVQGSNCRVFHTKMPLEVWMSRRWSPHIPAQKEQAEERVPGAGELSSRELVFQSRGLCDELVP